MTFDDMSHIVLVVGVRSLWGCRDSYRFQFTKETQVHN